MGGRSTTRKVFSWRSPLHSRTVKPLFSFKKKRKRKHKKATSRNQLPETPNHSQFAPSDQLEPPKNEPVALSNKTKPIPECFRWNSDRPSERRPLHIVTCFAKQQNVRTQERLFDAVYLNAPSRSQMTRLAKVATA